MIAGDHAGRFHALDALGHRRLAHVDAPADFGERGAGVGLQDVQDFRVHGVEFDFHGRDLAFR